ncbi:MAG TPA: UDP-N-acetylglucosamine 2-epimerase [Longimicrobiales bacterium]|nr:UDP-N-acetylglucosamine 2-epimerase [Longimicrobiales bacterium]
MTSANGDGTADPQRRLFLVDLSGTPDNRRATRFLARMWVSAHAWIRSLRGEPGPQVLVFAPAADGKSVKWPRSAELIFADELLDLDTLEEIDDWVTELSGRIVDALESRWPQVAGISLGQLNRLDVQDFLLGYARVTESLRRALDVHAPGDCVILSGYPEVGKAMRRDMEARQEKVRVRALPSLRPPAALTTEFGRDEGLDVGLKELAPRVLLVSESVPMAGLFGSVERELTAEGITPWLRVQFGNEDGGMEWRPEGAVLHLRRPDQEQPRLPSGFRDLRAAIEHLDVASPGPYHPPVEMLLRSLLMRNVPRQLRHLERMRRVIDATRPELVVVGNDRWWLGLTAVLLAREAGIPTLAVQDGVAWYMPMWGVWSADRVAVNGPQLGDFLVRHGLSRERINVVGQPRYDDYNAKAAASVREDARADLGLAEGEFSVLFATQPDQDSSYVRSVVEAILAVPDVTLLLRPHPSTGARALEEIRSLVQGDRTKWCGGNDIFQLISASDVVVVQYSTVALEAAILGRPVITANLTGLRATVPYAEIGISVEARSPARISELVAQARDGALRGAEADERIREGIHFLVGPTDGKSAARVKDIIQEMLAGAR